MCSAGVGGESVGVGGVGVGRLVRGFGTGGVATADSAISSLTIV